METESTVGYAIGYRMPSSITLINKSHHRHLVPIRVHLCSIVSLGWVMVSVSDALVNILCLMSSNMFLLTDTISWSISGPIGPIVTPLIMAFTLYFIIVYGSPIVSPQVDRPLVLV